MVDAIILDPSLRSSPVTTPFSSKVVEERELVAPSTGKKASYLKTRKEVNVATVAPLPEEAEKIATIQQIGEQSQEIATKLQAVLADPELPKEDASTIKVIVNIMMLMATVCSNSIDLQSNGEYQEALLMNSKQDELKNLQNKFAEVSKKLDKATHSNKHGGKGFWAKMGIALGGVAMIGLGVLIMYSSGGAAGMAGPAIAAIGKSIAIAGVCTAGSGFFMAGTSSDAPGQKTIDPNASADAQNATTALNFKSDAVNSAVSMFSKYVDNYGTMSSQMANFIQKACQEYGEVLRLQYMK